MRKTYSQTVSFESFLERYEYLRLHNVVAYQTFGGSRWVNQRFYTSREWKLFRRDIILRDGGCDLAVPDRIIHGPVILHHITPITKEDLLNGTECLLDPENVICVSHLTHNALHYGDSSLVYQEPVIRRPNDTCPWKGGNL